MGSRTESILRREKMEVTIPVLIEQFCATKQIEGKSPKMVRWYCESLARFVKYLGECKLPDLTLQNARGNYWDLGGKLGVS